MFKIFRFIVASAAVISSLPAIANEMKCGEHYISGGQIEPLSSAQVVEKCGEPTSTSEASDHWYYEEQGKILVFNSDRKLQTIRDAEED
jgi:hypothetical protein